MDVVFGKTKFDRWLVLGEDANPKFWMCQCECGTKRRVCKKNLKSGGSRSCDCLRQERATTHGRSGTKTYKLWYSMFHRTNNVVGYIKKGIKVCERWQKFENFLADMGECPPEKYSVDRIDNSKGYEPGNCRWADRSEQQRNKTTTRMVTFRGKTQAASAWAEEVGLSQTTVLNRLDRGWTVERALTTPAGLQRGRGAPQSKDRLLEYKGKTQTLAQWAIEFRLNVTTMIERVWNGWPMERIASTPQGIRGGHSKAKERNEALNADPDLTKEGSELLRYLSADEAWKRQFHALRGATDRQSEAVMNFMFGGETPLFSRDGDPATRFCVSDERAARGDT